MNKVQMPSQSLFTIKKLFFFFTFSDEMNKQEQEKPLKTV